MKAHRNVSKAGAKGHGSDAKAKRSGGAKTAAVRIRRSPEEARRLILEAAERVFAKHLPDVVGLKDVAKEAGVSHALVTHYFGTYAALVEATLEGRFRRLRDELIPVMVGLVESQATAATMLAAHRSAMKRAISDPTTVRLAIWALLSGRADADDFFPHRVQGMRLLADAISARLPDGASREDLEFLLFVSAALPTMFLLAGRAFTGALGRKVTRELEEGFERRTQALVEGLLRDVERRGAPAPAPAAPG